jgi:PAS domain S-box-containing protein
MPSTRLEVIVEAVPALIGYIDAEERYRFNNSAYEHWFGLPLAEVAGRTLREILGEGCTRSSRPTCGPPSPVAPSPSRAR